MATPGWMATGIVPLTQLPASAASGGGVSFSHPITYLSIGGETTIWTYTLPAGKLADNYDSLRIISFYKFTAASTNKTFRLKFGGVQIFSANNASGIAINYKVEIFITRVNGNLPAHYVDAALGPK